MTTQRHEGRTSEGVGNVPNSTLRDRFVGAILGGAIGDALGSPIEGLVPSEVRERLGDWVEGFVPPAVSRRDDRHKGDGNVSDDSLMTVALIRAYIAKGGQLEAHDMASHFLTEFADKPMWVPELNRDMLLLDRVFLPEKQLFLRLRLLDISPRDGGQGNMVNCGAAMYAAPIGLMNAAAPDEAYRRAIDVLSAHQSSFGLEAAGVVAACVATAARPDADIASVIDTARTVAKDGTRDAIEAVLAAVPATATLERPERYARLREAMEPYDTRKGDVGRYVRVGTFPSQRHAIEELPLALAFLQLGRGDFRSTMLEAVNYGRDSDSVAGIAGAVLGALIGRSGLPDDWVDHLVERNRIDFAGLAHDLLELFTANYRRERRRAERREVELKALLTPLEERSG